jgi:hypothetical protein
VSVSVCSGLFQRKFRVCVREYKSLSLVDTDQKQKNDITCMNLVHFCIHTNPCALILPNCAYFYLISYVNKTLTFSVGT